MNPEHQRTVDLYLQVKQEFDRLYYDRFQQGKPVSREEWQDFSSRIEQCSPEICVLELRTQLYWYAKMAYFLSGGYQAQSCWARLGEPRGRISLLSELFGSAVPEELKHALPDKARWAHPR